MLDALTLDQMRSFVTVAESGSFRAGAGRLSRAQSGISVSIANLEAQLGALLFDRSGHKPSLTAEGKALLADARDILLRVDAMRARARGFGEGVELDLSIVVDTLFPMAAIGAAMVQMRKHYPSVAVRVSVEPLGGPLQALTDGRGALAIMVGEDFRDPRISFEALSTVTQVAVVAADHPLATLPDIGIPDLADHLQIVLSDPSLLTEGRDFGVISPQSCRVSTQDAKHALIRSGVGWGRLPLWLVEDDLRRGDLVRLATSLLGRDAEHQAQAYLARRLDQPFGPAARSFAAALAALC